MAQNKKKIHRAELKISIVDSKYSISRIYIIIYRHIVTSNMVYVHIINLVNSKNKLL